VDHVTTPALQVEALTLHRRDDPSRPLLHEVAFTVPARGAVALVGASGSGKTLTIRSILRLLPPSLVLAPESRVHVGGVDATLLTPAALPAWRAATFGLVPAGVLSALDPVRTVREHAARIATISPAVDADLTELLRAVGLDHPARFLDRHPHTLSGGEAQRVALALALLRRPPLLIVDELTTALDALGREEVVGTLREARAATNAALVLVTHDLDVATALADEVVVLDAGRAVARGTPRTLWTRADVPAVRALVDAWPLLPTQATPADRTPGAASVLAADDITVHLGSTAALRHVTLTVAAGERVAIVGRSGSGKSTLARALVGLEPCHHGRVQLNGAPLPPAHERHWRRSVQWVMQDAGRSLDPRRSVAQAVADGRAAHDLPTPLSLIDALLAEVELPAELRTRYPHELSTGQRQRVALARALAVEPAVLVLDEPLTSLDPLTAARFAALLARLHRVRPLTLVTILHDLAIAPRVADRIVVLHEGQLIEDGPSTTLLVHPTHPVTIALRDAARRASLSVPSGA
jgi:peptide/nickel transport system ATP-binding protein